MFAVSGCVLIGGLFHSGHCFLPEITGCFFVPKKTRGPPETPQGVCLLNPGPVGQFVNAQPYPKPHWQWHRSTESAVANSSSEHNTADGACGAAQWEPR